MSRGTLDPRLSLPVSSTGLSPSSAGLPRPFDYLSLDYARPNPFDIAIEVWPLPRSLATTCGISVDFFSSAYLDVSVRRVPSVHLFYSVHSDRSLHLPGFPIRIPTDRCLFAAPRGFSQLVASFFG